jgi:hypothetical protein
MTAPPRSPVLSVLSPEPAARLESPGIVGNAVGATPATIGSGPGGAGTEAAGVDQDVGQLRALGAILLVSCYELGHQPVALAGPLAVLRAAGFAPVAVDTAVDPLPEAVVAAAALVAIAVPMHTALRLGVAAAEKVRRINPAAHVCFYGLYATLNARHLLGTESRSRGVEEFGERRLGVVVTAGPFAPSGLLLDSSTPRLLDSSTRAVADSVVSGELEAALLALAEALDRGEPAEAATGIGTVRRPSAPVLEPLPAALRGLPPDRRGLPGLRAYARLEREGTAVPAGAIEATRGCHHTCRHCPIPPIYGGRFFVVPREAVVADGRAQVAAGARHLTFTDPDFFNGPGHGLRIMRDLRSEFPGLTFDATIKVEHLLQHRRRLPELAELGCAFVVTAVESLSAEVLTRLDKGHTPADVEAALALLDAVGVPMRPSLLPFTPWETLAGYVGLLRWVAERDLVGCVDPVMLSIRLLVPPGSSLLAEAESAAWLGELDAANFTHRWAHPDPRMDDLHRQVAAIVERAAPEHEPTADTFGRIWDAAHAVAGVPGTPRPAPAVRRPPAPRLTESWFC